MMRNTLATLVVLSVVGWLAGCSQPAPAPPAPTAPKEEPKKEEPKKEEAKVEQAAPAAEFKNVYFDFDKYEIKPEFVAAVKSNAASLKSNKDLRVTIEGHCDERGTTEYNLQLGERRANAIRRALTAEGVEAGRLKVQSWGEEKPADAGHDEAAWAKNRRAVVVQ
jgi:peptidoglycan-associated lipoprotein